MPYDIAAVLVGAVLIIAAIMQLRKDRATRSQDWDAFAGNRVAGQA